MTWPFWLCLILHTLYTLLNAKPIGDDSYLHPMWLELFSEQFRAGDLYPRWLFETYGSFGSPTFYLYPPLTYFFGAIVSFLGIESGVTLYNIVQYAALLLSGYTSFLLLKELGATKKIATIGALVYAFNPYHFVDVFARSALSEHVALAFLPLVFLGIERLSQPDKLLRDKRQLDKLLRGTVLMLVGWSLLILTNIPTLCIAGIGGLAMLFTKRDGKLFAYAALAFIGALAVTAFYWMPAYHFAQFTHTDALWGIAGKAIPDQILVVLALTAVLFFTAIPKFYRQTSDAGQMRGWFSLAVLALVLMIPYITDLLYTIYPFKLIQFNWRFMTLAMLALIVLMMRNERYARIAMPVVGIATFGLYLVYGFTYVFRETPYYEQPIKRDAPEYTTKWVPYADSVLIPFLQQHENDSVITSKQEDHVAVLASGIGPSSVWADLSSSAGIVRLHQFYWPQWKVTFNYQDLPISYDEHGFLLATLPAGWGTLRATMRESEVERISNWISLASIIALAGISVRIRRKKE